MSEPAKLLRYIEEITVMQSRHFFGRLRPAPEFRGPKADSGFDQIGSAPAPDKKRQLQAAPTPGTKISHL